LNTDATNQMRFKCVSLWSLGLTELYYKMTLHSQTIMFISITMLLTLMTMECELTDDILMLIHC